MDVQVRGPGGPEIAGYWKGNRKILFSPTIERRRASDVEAKDEEERRCAGHGACPTGQCRDCSGSDGARVLAILALVSSTRGNKRMEFVTRGFNAAINIRRCVVLKTRHDGLI